MTTYKNKHHNPYKEDDEIMHTPTFLDYTLSQETRNKIINIYKVRRVTVIDSLVCDVVGSDSWTEIPNDCIKSYMLYSEVKIKYPEYFI